MKIDRADTGGLSTSDWHNEGFIHATNYGEREKHTEDIPIISTIINQVNVKIQYQITPAGHKNTQNLT